MFQRIEYDAMVSGKRYKVGETSGIFIKIFHQNGIWYLKFRGMEKKDKTRITYVSQYFQFYQYVSQKPQWKMERRSVNLIVRRLIGDEHFEW